jgi:hypothetical protein
LPNEDEALEMEYVNIREMPSKLKCQNLNGNEHLKKGAEWVPLLLRPSLPGAQNGKANFAIIVQIWIESDIAGPGCQEGTFWRLLGIIHREKDVKFEEAILIGRVVGTGHQNLTRKR